MNLFADAWNSFRLTIHLRKSKVMFTPSPGQPDYQPKILVDRKRLEMVDLIVYPVNTLSQDGTLDAEIVQRNGKATKSFACLENRVKSDGNITLNIKVKFYESYVLTALLYFSETWASYRRHNTTLEKVRQKFLRIS